MGHVKLSQIIVSPLREIETKGGNVLHALKCSEAQYKGFGEVYFSWINPGVIKAWKRHNKMTMNLVVPIGMTRFVFHSDEESGFRSETIGVDSYQRLTVPPSIWFGFQCISEEPALVLNIIDIEHSPDEVDRRLLEDIKFDW